MAKPLVLLLLWLAMVLLVKALADWSETANKFLTSLIAIVGLIFAEIAALPHLDTGALQWVVWIDIVIIVVASAMVALIWARRRPRLEISINLERYSAQGDPQYPEMITSESISQCLNVTAKNNSIRSLAAKVTVDKRDSTYFGWKPSIPLPKDTLHIDLVAEEDANLPIWMAHRGAGGDAFVTLNGLRSHKLSDFTQPKVEIEIQFIGENYTDKKPRKYALNVQTWEKLGLTESD